jgi:DNA-binding Lrp family transcriptional regulator
MSVVLRKLDIMDDTDQRLIASLRHDARRSISDLALELGLSRATVRARISRLERERLILGYSVIVKGDADALPVRGIMMIEIEGRSTDQVIQSLSGLPEISAIHTTNGRWDLVAEIGASDLIAFDAVLRRIRLLPAIRVSETNLLLATSRSTKAVRR